MGKVISIVRKVLFFFSAVACLCITVYNMDNVELDANGTIYLVDEYADTYYEMLSDNVGLTTINGISNVFVNMRNDGYTVYKSDVTDSYIDVSFVKDGSPSYRYYYTHPEGRITFFSSEYENSYMGLAYIIEKKE